MALEATGVARALLQLAVGGVQTEGAIGVGRAVAAAWAAQAEVETAQVR